MNLADQSSVSLTPTRALRAPLIAVSLLGAVLVAGCNRAEAPETAPAAPASSAPAPASPGASQGTAAPGAGTPSGSTPASSAPAGSAAPSSSSATPGTPDGARASLPPSEAATGSKPVEGMAKDAKETDPKGDLTKKEESQGMPEALQAGNNHSSTALDTEPKKP